MIVKDHLKAVIPFVVVDDEVFFFFSENTKH
jgi:hypothetical protein